MLSKIVFSILMLFSGSVLADTYPAVSVYSYSYGSKSSDTLLGLCQQFNNATQTWTASPPSSCRVDYSYGGFDIQPINAYTSYTCPYSGTVSGSNCINATPCTAPAVRDSTGECNVPVDTCPSDQYDLSGVCTQIPDCNLNSSTGGNFFDKVDKICKSGDLTICISDINTKYCPPIEDCKPSGYICSNDTAVVDAAAASRASEIAAAKSKADAVKAEIVSIESQAVLSAAAKEAAALEARTAKDAAKTAVDAAIVAGVPSVISQAIEAYNKFAQDYIDSLSRAINSDGAAQKAKDVNEEAAAPVAAIPTANPGNADAYVKQMGPLLGRAIAALGDAVSGDGDGDGRGSGLNTSSSPSVDTSGLAKDATLSSILDSLTAKATATPYVAGTANGGESEKGSFDDSNASALAQVDALKADLSTKIDEIKTAMSGMFSGAVTSGSASLPVIDFGNMKGKQVVLDMNSHAAQLSLISPIILAMAFLIALAIITSR